MFFYVSDVVASVRDDLVADTFYSSLKTVHAFGGFFTGAYLVVLEIVFLSYAYR